MKTVCDYCGEEKIPNNWVEYHTHEDVYLHETCRQQAEQRRIQLGQSNCAKIFQDGWKTTPPSQLTKKT